MKEIDVSVLGHAIEGACAAMLGGNAPKLDEAGYRELARAAAANYQAVMNTRERAAETGLEG